MASLLECRFLHRTLTIDDISKKPHCKNLKFKRAFQFLQLLLLQRVYGIDVITSSCPRRTIKDSQQDQEKDQDQQQNYQVFLGGSCNPTTWRHDQAIPYFQSRSVSFYNPQRPDWSPELIEIEHRAKELAPLLFFVIDHDTRALASIVEVCYLAARRRNIIVVMNPMPEKNYTKFIQQKKSIPQNNDDDKDYENACEARRTLKALLQSIDVPVFDNVRLALECAAFILETTKRTVTSHSVFDEDNHHDGSDQDVLTPLPMSPSDCQETRSSPIVVIRSLSNKTTYNSTDEFYKQMRQSEMTQSLPIPLTRRHSSSPEPNIHQFRPAPICTKTQLSSSTNESDDDGYGSLASSNRALSASSSSLSSESFEAVNDQQREDHSSGSHNILSAPMINHLIQTFYSYIPFVSVTSKPAESSESIDSSATQSLFVLLTLPFRFIKETLLSPTSPSTVPLPLPLPLPEPVHLNSTSCSLSRCPFQSSYHMFDLYIASGEHDECWLNTFALPTLEQININYIKRQSYHDNDQPDAMYDVHVRKQSRVLYYLINSTERLSYLTSELAFLIGEHKHKIIIYLQSPIDDNSEHILSACERRDIQRSRKYLEDLARKENIILSHSREQSWQEVLAIFVKND